MDLTEQYKQLHAEGHMSGSALDPFISDVRRSIQRTDARTVLDYGCGKASSYRPRKGCVACWGNTLIYLYDPAIPEFAELPRGTFDGIICTDVIEHFEEVAVYETLDWIFTHATRFVFLSTCCRAANLKLPDGTNAHKTIRPEQWWMKVVQESWRRSRHNVLYDLRFTP